NSWTTESYGRHTATLQQWAEKLSPTTEGRQLEVDDVELLIFQDARGISPSDTRSENVTVESMLEDLGAEADARSGDAEPAGVRDRKSTRLNSSHVSISYAVLRSQKKKA